MRAQAAAQTDSRPMIEGTAMDEKNDCRQGAEWCNRQARQCTDFLTVEILTVMAKDLMEKAERLERAAHDDHAMAA